jgi:hypothetical protein
MTIDGEMLPIEEIFEQDLELKMINISNYENNI